MWTSIWGIGVIFLISLFDVYSIHNIKWSTFCWFPPCSSSSSSVAPSIKSKVHLIFDWIVHQVKLKQLILNSNSNELNLGKATLRPSLFSKFSLCWSSKVFKHGLLLNKYEIFWKLYIKIRNFYWQKDTSPMLWVAEYKAKTLKTIITIL